MPLCGCRARASARLWNPNIRTRPTTSHAAAANTNGIPVHRTHPRTTQTEAKPSESNPPTRANTNTDTQRGAARTQSNARNISRPKGRGGDPDVRWSAKHPLPGDSVQPSPRLTLFTSVLHPFRFIPPTPHPSVTPRRCGSCTCSGPGRGARTALGVRARAHRGAAHPQQSTAVARSLGRIVPAVQRTRRHPSIALRCAIPPGSASA